MPCRHGLAVLLEHLRRVRRKGLDRVRHLRPVDSVDVAVPEDLRLRLHCLTSATSSLCCNSRLRPHLGVGRVAAFVVVRMELRFALAPLMWLEPMKWWQLLST